MFGRSDSIIVSCPDHVQLAPSEKLSGEPSQISWACYYSVARVVKLLTAVSQLRYRSVFEQGCQTLLGYMVRGSLRNSAWFARLFFLVKRVCARDYWYLQESFDHGEDDGNSHGGEIISLVLCWVLLLKRRHQLLTVLE